jgi:ketosteroid isomerase-like protein
MKRWIQTSIAIFALAFISTGYAHTQEIAKNVIQGWFTAMKDKQFDKAASYLAPEFVSIHTDGVVRDKAQEMALIKKLQMTSFNLSDFKFSKSGNIITVTYKDKGSEKIDNKKIGAKAAGRLAVLQKQGDNWLIVAYANLDKIG